MAIDHRRILEAIEDHAEPGRWLNGRGRPGRRASKRRFRCSVTWAGRTRMSLYRSRMMNILNGGAHADNNVDIQEFIDHPARRGDLHRRAALGGRGLPRAEVGDQAARHVHRHRRRGRFRP